MATTDLNQLQNKKILVIFPHPDDETVMAGGLIRAAIEVGAVVTVVCLTHGERGKIHTHGWGNSLSEIRRIEFKKALTRLGVTRSEIFSYPDGNLRRDRKWVQKLNPAFFFDFDLVIGYDLSGVTGHPDHIALAKHLHQLSPTVGFTLWQASPVGILKKAFLEPQVASYLSPPEITITLSLYQRLRKWWAFVAYASQYNLITRLLALFTSLLPQSEGFSLYRPGRNYRFRFVPFSF